MNKWVWVGLGVAFVLLAWWLWSGGDDVDLGRSAASGGGDAGGEVPALACPALEVTLDGEALSLPYGLAMGWHAPGTNTLAGYLIVQASAPRSCDAFLAANDPASSKTSATAPPTASAFGTVAGDDPFANGVAFRQLAELGRKTALVTLPGVVGDSVVICVPEPVTIRDGDAIVRIRGRFEGSYCGMQTR